MFRPFNPFDDTAQSAWKTLRSADNPVPFPDWANNLAFKSALQQVLNNTQNPVWHADFPYYESLSTHPHSIRYRFNTRGRVVHPGPALEPWRVELARFAVPQRYFGVIRAFEQWISYKVEQDFVIYYAGLIQYGEPFVDAAAGIQGTWFMRLFPNDGQIRPWLNQINPPEERPGIPYQDWEDQNGIWYPAHSDAAQNIRLTVPGGYELAVFWECDGNTNAGGKGWSPAVSAAFKGGIQSSFNERALDNAFGSWS